MITIEPTSCGHFLEGTLFVIAQDGTPVILQYGITLPENVTGKDLDRCHQAILIGIRASGVAAGIDEERVKKAVGNQFEDLRGRKRAS